MNAIVWVPVGIRSPKPFANRPSSLANDVCKIVFVGPLIRSFYSNDKPVFWSMTELIDWRGRDWMARILAAIEYLVAKIG